MTQQSAHPTASSGLHNPATAALSSSLSSSSEPPRQHDAPPAFTPPSSVLIVGSGVFGLGTAYALARRPAWAGTSITVVDRAPDPSVFPARDASSVDTSRIVRADYSDPAYAALAAEAQRAWRRRGDDDLGGRGRYTEAGLVLVADPPPPGRPAGKTGMGYVRSSWANVQALAAAGGPGLAGSLRELPGPDAIRAAVGTGGASGAWGYLNRASGWADAEASMAWLYGQVRATGRVRFVSGTVAALTTRGGAVTGAALAGGEALAAELVVVAAGAWTGALVDLAGQATATGQILAYMDLTDEEQARLAAMPTLLNMTTGLFVITPARNVLKVARHAYGYVNPTTAAAAPLGPSPEQPGAPRATVSLPVTSLDDPSLSIPASGAAALRSALREMVPLPGIPDRPFTRTRLCWYTDTPSGDFLIDYHPRWRGLFVATGGSGHGFKFLPVIGDKIADCVEGQCPPEFKAKWSWREGSGETFSGDWKAVVTEDGSRGGEPGLILQEEMAKGA